MATASLPTIEQKARLMLGRSALTVLNAIQELMAEGIDPTQERIGERARYSERQVRRALRELERLRLLQTRRRWGCNEYYLG